MSQIADHARTALGRGLLLALTIGAGLAAIFTLITGALHLENTMGLNWTFEVNVAAPDGRVPDFGTAAGSAEVQYSQVYITPLERAGQAQFLETLSVGSRYAIGLLTCAVVILLAVRLLTRRPFSRAATVALAGLAVAMCVVAVGAPWLRAEAVVSAVHHVGLPTTTQAAGLLADQKAWVAPQPYGWQDTDWSLLALGLTSGLCALLLARGKQLQDDTRGLI